MKNQVSNYVSIAGALGGIYLVIVLIFVLLANSNLDLLIPIVWAFVVLGVVLGHYQAKSKD